MPEQKTEPVTNSKLHKGQELGSRISLAVLPYKQFQSLRSQYLNVFIPPGQATEAYGVLVDGYLVGVFAVSTSTGSGQKDPATIYLMSDFPVADTDYPRLSKLIVYCALSREAKLLYERVSRHRTRYVFTTAFSNNPESMKYRSLLKVANRKENPDWSPENEDSTVKRYATNYCGEVGKWSLAEGFALWQKKYGTRETAK